VQRVIISEAEISARLFQLSKNGDHINFINCFNEAKKTRRITANFKGNNDWTYLHYATLNGNKLLVGFLLLKGAEIDALTTSNLTALMIAAQK
jgi:ankyrin repeat protein